MAKMGNGTGLRKIPLSQIVVTENVRINYTDIDSLAESMLKHGQLDPVLVKPMEPDRDGIEKFDLVAGHRRRLAAMKLCERGESFTTLDAIVVTGDRLTLQLVENIQRSDLTPGEREYGIYQMCRHGLSQKEVAARLSKPETYVSRNVSAYKIRQAAQEEQIDSSSLATGTLNEIQAAAPSDYPKLVKEIIEKGGTLEAARAIMENYRLLHGKPANPQKGKGKNAEKNGLTDPLKLHPSPVVDPVAEEFSAAGVNVDIDVNTSAGTGEPIEPELPNEEPAKPETKKGGTKKADSKPRISLDTFDPPHKQVDFNSVCLAIVNYGKKLDDLIFECERNGKKLNDCGVCPDAGTCKTFLMRETVLDILALLHAEL